MCLEKLKLKLCESWGVSPIDPCGYSQGHERQPHLSVSVRVTLVHRSKSFDTTVCWLGIVQGTPLLYVETEPY